MRRITKSVLILLCLVAPVTLLAGQGPNNCKNLPSYTA